MTEIAAPEFDDIVAAKQGGMHRIQRRERVIEKIDLLSRGHHVRRKSIAAREIPFPRFAVAGLPSGIFAGKRCLR